MNNVWMLYSCAYLFPSVMHAFLYLIAGKFYWHLKLWFALVYSSASIYWPLTQYLNMLAQHLLHSWQLKFLKVIVIIYGNETSYFICIFVKGDLYSLGILQLYRSYPCLVILVVLITRQLSIIQIKPSKAFSYVNIT